MTDKTQKEIIAELVDKTMRELSAPKKPEQGTRSGKSEYRRKSQLDDCARSVVRNIEEGWKRANTSDYLDFLGYSQGSLEEVKGDSRELTEDGFLPSKPGSSLASIGINLGEFNKALRPIQSSNLPLKFFKGNLQENKGNKKPNPDSDSDFAYRPITVLYPPLAKIKATGLTYEIFIELINKTDFLLRGLVESLEKKSDENKKIEVLERQGIRI